jgi:hypothetical protein
MTTIIETYRMSPVSPYKSRHGETQVVLSNQVVGIELEIEGFSSDHDREFGGIIFTTDGSLRSNAKGDGIEAITLPIQAKYVAPFLSAFFKRFEITEENYSERCSTHVHFNAQNLSYEQIAIICLLYQTVERLLFNFVGHERDKNIFCVPWSQCNIGYTIVNKIKSGVDGGDGVFRRWQKYSSLNLIPLLTKGTLEFRHLPGTCDVTYISRWIDILSHMFEYAQSHTLDETETAILQMNTVSNYHAWLDSVFKAEASYLQGFNTEALLAQGVVDSKLMIMSPIQPRWPVRYATFQDNITLDDPSIYTRESIQELLRGVHTTIASERVAPETPPTPGPRIRRPIRPTT